jgi:hypothetical protein
VTPPRAGTAVSRTTDLLELVDQYAREIAADTEMVHPDLLPGECLALRHLVECLTRIVRNHPGVAEMAETYAARACEALDLIEADL